ncbi:MAG TPA: hypothetical protein VJU13_12350 [Candidatus Nitrosocosmicus sp.]|nr:hypothetical protein [Candidatus Nitrosocosmicus sp.]
MKPYKVDAMDTIKYWIGFRINLIPTSGKSSKQDNQRGLIVLMRSG